MGLMIEAKCPCGYSSGTLFVGSGFSDFFEMFFGRGSDERFSSYSDLFGGAGTRTGSRQRTKQERQGFWGNGSAAQKGQDYQYNLDITLREAYFGTERAMKLQKDGKAMFQI